MLKLTFLTKSLFPFLPVSVREESCLDCTNEVGWVGVAKDRLVAMVVL